MAKEKRFEYFIKKNITQGSYDVYVRFCSGTERRKASFYETDDFAEISRGKVHAEQYAKSEAHPYGVYLGHLEEAKNG